MLKKAAYVYTCSKMRLDEFGGGAVGIKLGEKPYYIDAMGYVEGIVNQ